MHVVAVDTQIHVDRLLGHVLSGTYVCEQATCILGTAGSAVLCIRLLVGGNTPRITRHGQMVCDIHGVGKLPSIPMGDAATDVSVQKQTGR